MINGNIENEGIIDNKQRSDHVHVFVEKVCQSLDFNEVGDAMSKEEVEKRADVWAAEGRKHLIGDHSDIACKQIEDRFKEWEEKQAKDDNKKEFQKIGEFIFDEQNLGRDRRKKARILAASEEALMAAQVAELKGYRFKSDMKSAESDLRNKIADAERSYVNRKMVLSKAARLATADCRDQFARVRKFFQNLQNLRKEKLKLQYNRSLKLQSILHRIRKIDPRVMVLEQNTATRIFRKKEADINELNMMQNYEEAVYLESIINLLDRVQEAKEIAANEIFKLQIGDLKRQQEIILKQEEELNKFKAEATVEITKLVAKYVEEGMQEVENDNTVTEYVESSERTKDFIASSSNTLMNISKLYDTILWSVATSSIGMTSEGDSMYSSVFDYDHDAEEPVNDAKPDLFRFDDNEESFGDDTSSLQSGGTANSTTIERDERLSPVGNILVKQLTKELRMEEKTILKKHSNERKIMKRKFRVDTRELKRKHQATVDAILSKCVDERHRLRDAITQRMNELEQNQGLSTQSLQEAIQQDVGAMQQAWVEHKRLEDEQKSSFAKAQALVSAQVFHEVRNALSSVVAMSEMTSSLQKDRNVSSEALVSSVDEMLEQNKEVVNYSLNMLNNILDVSKIKEGSFKTKKKLFDLQDLVNRATKMQLVKAQTRGVNMSFTESSEPLIAYTDEDIVVRIVTNFISNAVKFTSFGAVQPFICPIEAINPDYINRSKPVVLWEELSKTIKLTDEFANCEVKIVAVGVADTGPGLTSEMLSRAKIGLSSADSSTLNSGAKNSGFGLHLAHQLAGSLDSEVFLTDLHHFHDLYSNEMSSVLNGVNESGCKNKTPGHGTVLYISVPILEDGNTGKKLLDYICNSDQSNMASLALNQYTFSPQPAIDSVDGRFHILVADDVAMLRKGLARSILDIFSKLSDCPVSISTACTAEDALRAISSHSFDLFICDNQFASPDHLKRISPEMEKSGRRPQIVNKEDHNSRQLVTDFFANEQFTIEQEDGSLPGLNALLQLVDMSDPPFPLPILVLHSGHVIELSQDSPIIVVQKPLKRTDFESLFENNARKLVNAGFCTKVSDNISREDKISIVNKRGSQIFTQKNF